jgi:hypothetical protein
MLIVSHVREFDELHHSQESEWLRRLPSSTLALLENGCWIGSS